MFSPHSPASFKRFHTLSLNFTEEENLLCFSPALNDIDSKFPMAHLHLVVTPCLNVLRLVCVEQPFNGSEACQRIQNRIQRSPVSSHQSSYPHLYPSLIDPTSPASTPFPSFFVVEAHEQSVLHFFYHTICHYLRFCSRSSLCQV
jgi:hypothetical protein